LPAGVAGERLAASERMTVTRCVLALVVAGCGTTVTSTMINASPKPLVPRAPESVEVFTSGPPQRPYVDVAYLEAEQTTDMSIDGTGAFITKLRRHAAEMGCDGVVLGAPTNRPVTATADVVYGVIQVLSKEPIEPPADFGRPANLRGMTATCIVYVPEDGELEAIANAYEQCKQQRIETMRAAQRLAKADERGRLLRGMPTCIKPAT
jgi:hypothetical protein